MVFIACLAASIIMHFVILEQKGNFILLLILMFEFGLSLIMFAFVLTTLFSKAKTAAVVGALSTTLVSFLYYLQIYLTNIPSYANWLLGLISPPAMTMAIDKVPNHYSETYKPLNISLLILLDDGRCIYRQ